MRKVQFRNRGGTVCGKLYLPGGFTEGEEYAAIVVVHPDGGVAEAARNAYAQRLSDQGYVTLAFDARWQSVDAELSQMDDVYSAVDYLSSLPYVADDRIGVLGLCMEGAIALKAVAAMATTEPFGEQPVLVLDASASDSVLDKVTPFFMRHL